MPTLSTRGLRKLLSIDGFEVGRKRIESYMEEMGGCNLPETQPLNSQQITPNSPILTAKQAHFYA